MDQCTLRANLRFLAAGMAAISAMALSVLLLARTLGGISYYEDVLYGPTWLPIWTGLTTIGAVAAAMLGETKRKPAARISEAGAAHP